ncbi:MULTISPECIES: integrase [unclassified Pseudomonas]|uniref:phage integrase n=1 Tax=unclassified Pseudomonas TaxID=196821 RepID=UPI0024482B28|nr:MULTISPECIES: integrase [unclassified Pseudomonas]MDG9930339.1 integrase [Pseudomonas sp. GD04042]MDH0484548.1 integrase [Pseudomonas sp. GD04015]MDH0605994.1 integrase [Pseudomonas sp. GD03869]
MRPKDPANRDMPPRMLKRVRTLQSGKQWVGYYYNGRDENGKRVETPLGSYLDAARTEWARLERSAEPPKPKHLMGAIFDRYEREIIPGKSPRTQQDNRNELKQLRKAFENAPIDAITPHVVAQYRDARTTKTRGNREIALLSHVINIAREWGLTDKENPCARVRRNKEKARDYYAADDVWGCVYAHAVQELRDAMDLAYLTGQRPADSIKPILADLTKEHMLVAQGKTTKRLRIRLRSDDGELTGLGRFIEGLLERRKLAGIRSSPLITNPNGLRLSYAMLRNRWNEARARAAKAADDDGDRSLAERIRSFQFRDIRPKAASEIEDLTAASRLLGHSKE